MPGPEVGWDLFTIREQSDFPFRLPVAEEVEGGRVPSPLTGVPDRKSHLNVFKPRPPED